MKRRTPQIRNENWGAMESSMYYMTSGQTGYAECIPFDILMDVSFWRGFFFQGDIVQRVRVPISCLDPGGALEDPAHLTQDMLGLRRSARRFSSIFESHGLRLWLLLCFRLLSWL